MLLPLTYLELCWVGMDLESNLETRNAMLIQVLELLSDTVESLDLKIVCETPQGGYLSTVDDPPLGITIPYLSHRRRRRLTALALELETDLEFIEYALGRFLGGC